MEQVEHVCRISSLNSLYVAANRTTCSTCSSQVPRRPTLTPRHGRLTRLAVAASVADAVRVLQRIAYLAMAAIFVYGRAV